MCLLHCQSMFGVAGKQNFSKMNGSTFYSAVIGQLAYFNKEFYAHIPMLGRTLI